MDSRRAIVEPGVRVNGIAVLCAAIDQSPSRVGIRYWADPGQSRSKVFTNASAIPLPSAPFDCGEARIELNAKATSIVLWSAKINPLLDGASLFLSYQAVAFQRFFVFVRRNVAI